ncbi:hypothetical protein Tco_0746478 [Tanacetum coccineum]
MVWFCQTQRTLWWCVAWLWWRDDGDGVEEVVTAVVGGYKGRRGSVRRLRGEWVSRGVVLCGRVLGIGYDE